MSGGHVSPVFYDPDQKRWPRVRRGAFATGALLTALIGALVLSILVNPVLPALHLPSTSLLPNGKGFVGFEERKDDRAS